MSRTHSRVLMLLFGLQAGSITVAGDDAVGQNRPDAMVISALRSNPATAPYPIRVGWEKGRIILSGKVGTSVIHDIAVRTAIDLGYPIRDDLVIDTGEVHRVAMEQAIRDGLIPAPGQPVMATSSPYFVYPEPLFGRVDDPFFGMEPPLLSFPPWQAGAAAGTSDPGRAQAAAGAPISRPGPERGKLRLTVDAAGQVFLSGLVASEEDKRIIEAEARNTPGVTRVYSELRVAPKPSDTPPPPPTPYSGPDAAGEGKSAVPPPPAPGLDGPKNAKTAPDVARPGLAMARDTHGLTHRVSDSLARRPSLASLPVGVTSSGDVVTIAGNVPSAYEAMLVFRAVEQTPGVRDIVDKLQFPVPDEDHPNPLLARGRPEDLEPYLTSQIRRHLGELAHIDRVRLRGDRVELRGTLLRADDRKRAEATVRSMPLLRDFKVDASFDAE